MNLNKLGKRSIGILPVRDNAGNSGWKPNLRSLSIVRNDWCRLNSLLLGLRQDEVCDDESGA